MPYLTANRRTKLRLVWLVSLNARGWLSYLARVMMPSRESDRRVAFMKKSDPSPRRTPVNAATAPFRPLRLLASLGLLPCLLSAGDPASQTAEPPALVVVISLDQFRQDYLERFRPYFVHGGFNLFLERGAVFANCHYRHSYTKTGPGHGVLLSGVHANIHGIIANDWLDRTTLARVYCCDDPAEQVVGLAPHTGPQRPGDRATAARSPRSYLATTVGDTLKLARGGRPKVIGLSNKDRAAILMAGHFADAAYYTEGDRFVTSTYYMRALPAWAEGFNVAKKPDAYFGKVWDRLLPVEAYSIQGPDDSPNEFTGLGLSPIFPKIITGGEKAPGPAFYEALIHTPFASEILADFARAAIDGEKLGQRHVTDLLAISFSANDLVGHDTGPDSHEVMDMVVRTDRILADFFTFLDQRIGLARCLIVLSADHGAAPTPEHLKALRPDFPAGRIDNALVRKTGEAALNRVFGPLAHATDRWLAVDSAWLHLDPETLARKQVAPAAAENVVRDALLTLDFVEAAYTRTQLLARDVNTELGRQALLSFHAGRSGDVFYQTKPYWIDFPHGTNHGSPYSYDTHVPLLWFGVGVPVGTHPERVGVDDLAPTLSRLLHLPVPPQSEGRALF